MIEDIRTMQQLGKTEQEIIQELQQRGLSRQEIFDALAQTQIKQAVNADDSYLPVPSPSTLPPAPETELQAPIPEPPAPTQTQETQYQEQSQQYQESQQTYPQQLSQEYQTQPQYQYDYQQQYPQTSISSDTISEITEQIITEKLSKIKNQIEKAIDVKTTAETKLSHIDERLQRIEKIIDRLQLSILQKIGEYGTNVSDLKKEVVETQKSFKSLSPKHPSPHTSHSTKKHKHHA